MTELTPVETQDDTPQDRQQREGMSECKYGDPTCPCQDGDQCHYEGENPMLRV